MSLNVFFVVWGFGLIVFNSAVFLMKGFNWFSLIGLLCGIFLFAGNLYKLLRSE